MACRIALFIALYPIMTDSWITVPWPYSLPVLQCPFGCGEPEADTFTAMQEAPAGQLRQPPN